MTIDADRSQVNSAHAAGRDAAVRELLKITIAMKMMPEAQFLSEIERAVKTIFLPLYECEYLEQDEIRTHLINAAKGRPKCIDAVDELVPEPRLFTPKPYAFPEPTTIKPRPKIMGDDYMRGYVSATVAPGGLGKSALVTVEILALVTGKRLLGRAPRTPKRVWYIGEDDQDEINRRFASAMRYYAISRADVGDRLFAESFRDNPLIIATSYSGGTVVNVSETRSMIQALKRSAMDVLTIDPLVKTHRAPENDNGAMDVVYTAWSDIAHKAQVAVHLIVHTRKGATGQVKSIEDIRGASSQLGALRSGRLIVRMEDAEADQLRVEKKHARLHIRIGDAKANMMPPADTAQWFKLNSVFLGNASTDPNADNQEQDSIQVVDIFKPSALFAGINKSDIDMFMRALREAPRRASDQTEDWVGNLVGDFLQIDVSEKPGRSLVKSMLKAWIASGSIRKINIPDEKAMPRPYIEIGNWFDPPEPC